ncbi:MAG: FimV/HubP family polar landmark protein [Deltaproteobacteria bacterium]|nr:FimV/HubP family polar landmark protein [Deltaproteobacteria bacterium]
MASTTSSNDGDEPKYPYARKLDLAEEFRQIGDYDGARELCEEVLSGDAEIHIKELAATMLRELNNNNPSAYMSELQSLLDKIPEHTNTIESRFRLLQDVAATELIATKDSLNRGILVKAISKLLKDRETSDPITIALFGHWGTGKSSMISLVSKELTNFDKPKFIFATFNAWQHEHATNKAAALGQCVLDALITRRSFLDRLILTIRWVTLRRLGLPRDKTSALRNKLTTLSLWMASVSMIAIPTLVILSAMLIASYQINLSPLLKFLSTTWVALLTFLLSVHKFMGDGLTDWFKQFNREKLNHGFFLPNYKKAIGTSHDIRLAIADLCHLTINSTTDPQDGQYLLILIDDLDRCAPESVKEILDCARLVANIDRVITVVAIDDRVAYSASEAYFNKFSGPHRESSQMARDYLAKVFQICISLPDPDAKAIKSFIRTHLFSQPPREKPKSLLDISLDLDSNIDSDFDFFQENQDETKSNSVRTIPGEVGEFVRVAHILHISNPRQLWRLKQAWSILKGLIVEELSKESAELWIQHLMLRENILQSRAPIRLGSENWLVSGGNGEAPPQLSSVLEYLGSGFVAGYLSRKPLVDAVLLPASQA